MDFKTRLEQDKERPAGKELSTEPEDNFTCKYFAKSNTGSFPACIDLRLPDGKRKALPYSFFTEINFDNETGIEIITSSKKITITGRNLATLFDYLVSYRVKFVRANIGNDQKEEGLFVKDILIEEIEQGVPLMG